LPVNNLTSTNLIAGAASFGFSILAVPDNWVHLHPAFGRTILSDTVAYVDPAQTEPGYMQSFQDPLFGTIITRISDNPGNAVAGLSGCFWGTDCHTQYMKRSAWNADDSLFWLETNSGGSGTGPIILDGQTFLPKYNPTANMPTNDRVLWHPTNPNLFYGTDNASSAIIAYAPSTSTRTTQKTFSGYTSINFGPFKGNLTRDGSSVVVRGTRTSDAADVCFAYNIDTDTKYPDILCNSHGTTPGHAEISSLGNYVLINYSEDDHIGVFQAATGSFIYSTAPGHPTHYSCLAIDGVEYMVGRCDGSPNSGFITKIRVNDGSQVALTSSGYMRETGVDNHGDYFVVADSDVVSPYTWGELLGVYADGGDTKFYRLGYSRNAAFDYEAETMPNQSRKGGKVTFSSDWLNSATGRPVQLFLIDLPHGLLAGAANLGQPGLNSPSPLVISDYALDGGMQVFPNKCDRIYVCTGPITSFATAISTSVGYKLFGAGNAFGGINNGAPSGRIVTSIPFVDGNITANGTANYWAAVDFADSQLLAYGVLSGAVAVTTGRLFGLSSFVIHEPAWFSGGNVVVNCQPAVSIATAAAGFANNKPAINQLLMAYQTPLISIDGSAQGPLLAATTTATVTLTTTQPNDVIVVATAYNGPVGTVISSITGGGLTFAARGFASYDSSGANIEEWRAVAPTPLNAVTFTVTFNQSTAGSIYGPYAVASAFGISGASFFDTHSGLPIQTTGTTGTDPVSISTSAISDFIFGFFRSSGPVGAGFTQIINANGVFIEYAIATGPQSGFNVTIGSGGTGTSASSIVDAVVAHSLAGLGQPALTTSKTIALTAFSFQQVHVNAFGTPVLAKTGSYVFSAVSLTSGAALIGSPIPISGTVYYVSPTGNDAANGTSTSTPWATLAKVNSSTFKPGDVIRLAGGNTFNVTTLTPSSSGTAAYPIVYTSYGTGRATVAPPAASGLYIGDKDHLLIDNINFTATGSNLAFDLSSNTGIHTDITVQNFTATGGGGNYVGGDTGSAGWSNVTIQNFVITGAAADGLGVYGNVVNGRTNSNITVQNGVISGCGQNGCYIGNTQTGLIHNVVAHHNGATDTSAGPVGLWCYESDSIVIQFCEAYNNSSPVGIPDGDGFDIDGGSTNCTIQYCYAHDNWGAGFLLWNYNNLLWNNNTVRYCIGQNNGAGNTSAFYAEVTIGSCPNALVYNNTFYNNESGGRVIAIESASAGGRFANNILYSTSNPLVLTSAGSPSFLQFTGNDYFASSTFVISWNNVNYSSVAAWQTATGQELISGGNVGLSVNPVLSNPGNGGTIGGYNPLLPIAYELDVGSPMLGAGLNLNLLFGINIGIQDFYGNQLNSFSIGAFSGAGLAGGALLDLNFLTGVYFPGPPASELVDARSSSKLITDSSGNITSVAVNALPLNNAGLLIEPASTNLQTHSLYDALGITNNVATIINAAAGPDGTTTAFSLIDNATNDTHFASLAQSSFIIGKNYTFSKYYKAHTASLVQMTTFGVAFGLGYANFSLSGAGSVTQTSGLTSSGITAYSNGWYRCWITILATASLQDTCVDALINSSAAGRTPSYAGTGTGVYIWNSQTEFSLQSNLPTSPIITTTTPMSRASDRVAVAPAGIGYFILTYSDGVTLTVEAEEDFTENSIMTAAVGFDRPALAVNNKPLVISTNFTLGLPATVNQVIGTMTGTNSPTSWSIIGGNPNGYFAINNSGQLTITSTGALNLSPTALYIDGSSLGPVAGATTTCTVALTTTQPNDLIIIHTTYNGPPGIAISSIAGGGLTFAPRGFASADLANGANMEEWWAVAPTALNAVTFTVTFNQNTTGSIYGPYAIAMAMGIAGENLSPIFDPNHANVLPVFDAQPGLPIQTSGLGGTDPVSISTSFISNELIFGIFRSAGPPGTGYTQIVNGHGVFAEYGVERGPLSGLSVTIGPGGTGTSASSIIDAVIAADIYAINIQATNSSGSEVGTATVTVQLRAGFNSFTARPLATAAAGIDQPSMITKIFDLNFLTGVYFPAPPASELVDTRASVKLLTDASGNITSVVANTLPLNATGLLIEQQVTNLQTHSLYDSLATTNNVVTIINAVAGPNGTTTALSLKDNASNTSHYVALSQPSFVSGKTYTFSKYYKPNTASLVQMTTVGTVFGVSYANFSLSGAGSVTQSSGVSSGLLSSGITSFSNGWYRCWITMLATVSGQDACLDVLINSSAASRLPSYVGTGTGIYVWQSQAELSIRSNLPTSPIITTSVAATRSADLINVPTQVGYFVLTYSDGSTQTIEAEEDFTENSITSAAASLGRPVLFADNRPLVNSISPTLALPATSNEAVVTITATNNPTSWSIIGGNPNGYFAINNIGQITVTAAGAAALVMPNLVIDGTAAPTFTRASGPVTITLTTTKPNDLIVIVPVYNAPGGTFVTSVTGGGLTFAHRATGGDADAGGANNIEEWWAVAPTVLNAVTFTVNFNQSNVGAPEGPYTQLMAIGIAGANTAAPFDVNANLPIQVYLTNLPTDPVSVNTSYISSEMILGMFRAVAPTAGPGFTTAITGTNTIIEYDVVSSAQTGLSVGLTVGAGSSNGGIVDAIVSASSYTLIAQATNAIGSGVGTAVVITT
jgi:hypothetical protein